MWLLLPLFARQEPSSSQGSIRFRCTHLWRCILFMLLRMLFWNPNRPRIGLPKGHWLCRRCWTNHPNHVNLTISWHLIKNGWKATTIHSKRWYGSFDYGSFIGSLYWWLCLHPSISYLFPFYHSPFYSSSRSLKTKQTMWQWEDENNSEWFHLIVPLIRSIIEWWNNAWMVWHCSCLVLSFFISLSSISIFP